MRGRALTERVAHRQLDVELSGEGAKNDECPGQASEADAELARDTTSVPLCVKKASLIVSEKQSVCQPSGPGEAKFGVISLSL